MAFNRTPHVGRMFPAAGLTPSLFASRNDVAAPRRGVTSSSTRRALPVDLEAHRPIWRSEICPNDNNRGLGFTTPTKSLMSWRMQALGCWVAGSSGGQRGCRSTGSGRRSAGVTRGWPSSAVRRLARSRCRGRNRRGLTAPKLRCTRIASRSDDGRQLSAAFSWTGPLTRPAPTTVSSCGWTATPQRPAVRLLRH
jgi:hypothetical protein